MDNFKQTLKTYKDETVAHIRNHRVVYTAAVSVTATVAVLNKIDRVSEWNRFLEEKGLKDEFYLVEDQES